jgi:hypothetical protein
LDFVVVFMSFFLNRCPSSCCLPLASPAVEPARRARERSQFPSESGKRDRGGAGGRGRRWRDFRSRSHQRRGGGTVSGKQWCDGERLKANETNPASNGRALERLGFLRPAGA